MSNGEKYKRRWLIYFIDLDRVFCFCCKLFNVITCTSKLGNEGSRDWRNLSAKLKNREKDYLYCLLKKIFLNEINYDNLIDNFASQKAWKINFRWKYHNFNYFINLKNISFFYSF